MFCLFCSYSIESLSLGYFRHSLFHFLIRIYDCHFALWKDNRYLQSMEKTMDKKMAAELLKSGCVHVKDLYSRKKNMYFEADLHMDADETGRVNFSLSFPKKKPKNKSKKK